MKEIKSREVNYKLLIFSLFFLFFLFVESDLDLLNIYTILILIILIGLSFYEIRLNSQGIVRKNLFSPFLKTIKKLERNKVLCYS